ncbi:hypothetical protein [Thermococcus sp. 2319x1]|uniref:plasmid mobilization protein n=1 Tax=Thermococcus sp. 2319x1 TaxID=1674923 RepID=UPI00158288E1|nr:hypothetical protein [Thermococcus sp. 2319x1]
MFEDVIKRLTNIRTNSASEISAVGTKAFEAILVSRGLDNHEAAIRLALNEFSKYADEDTLHEFEIIIRKEFEHLVGARTIKAKAKALKELWEAEVKAILSPQKRTKIVGVRLSEEEYAFLSAEAAKRGLTISEYIRKKLGFE